jgi:glycosyltransferase involved in cell wall biosynthesis
MSLNNVLVPSVVTCHAGARDNYQLPLAFQEISLLDTLVTDFYAPDYLRGIVKKRFHPNLSSKKVSWKCFDLINGPIFKRYPELGRDLSLRAAQVAIKHQSNLFVSSYTADAAFDYVDLHGAKTKKYLFQLHPHPDTILNILREEIDLGLVAADELSYEAELNPVTYSTLSGEALKANWVCVASTFTKKSLVAAGVDVEKIHVIPYGVNHAAFVGPVKGSRNGKLKILFCGQFIHRKGIYYLHEALRKFDSQHYELRIVTRGECDKKSLAMFSNNLNVEIYSNISNRELKALMNSSDIFILPSLYEGFGHVILEAMSAGLPVITTANTSGCDLITNDQDGFVGAIRDIDFLVEKIEFFIDRPMCAIEYGEQAAMTARKYTWESFRKKITDFYIKTEKIDIE